MSLLVWPVRPAWWVSIFVVACMVLSGSGQGWSATKSKAKAKSHESAALSGGPGTDAKGMPTFDTAARFAVVIDYNSGATLLDKNADEHMPTASMSKIMTMYQVGLDLKAGKAKPDDMLPVSQEAWKTGGSKMFVPYPGQVKVSDLLRGVMIQSGNDACVVLAEGLAGSTSAFVAEMNATAQKLGLANSHFADVDGLPDPNHYMSPRDLVMLSENFIRNFPDLYKLASEREFTFNGIKQGNRNPLLYKDIGADGIKTGHTDEAGYGLVGSAVRNGRRIIIVIAGLPSMRARDQESERLMDWAFRSFEDVTVAKTGATVDRAPVWLGEQAEVPVSTSRDAVMTVPRGAGGHVKVTAVYDGPVRAPVSVGEKVGELQVAMADGATVDYPLVALAPVKKLGPVGRAAQGIAQYIWDKQH
jgi:serine-type D-Ala-D-Ala carboxypeptidase (penicillin-binding protein 5/6)